MSGSSGFEPAQGESGSRNRNIVIGVVAVLVVALGAFAIYLFTSRGGDESDVTGGEEPKTRQTPAETAEPEQTDEETVEPETEVPSDPMEPIGDPVAVHGDPGHWLLPEYADGATELKFEGEGDVRWVGFDDESSIIVVHYLSEMIAAGVSVPSGEEVWTYDTYSCSAGSWNGMALCAEGTDPLGARDAGQPLDLVMIDMSDGSEVDRFDIGALPDSIKYIGADDSRAYFGVNNFLSAEGFGEAGLLALNLDGSLAWHSALDADGGITEYTLAAGDTIAMKYGFGGMLLLAERSSGSLIDQIVNDDGMTIFWDGYGVYDSESYAVGSLFSWDGSELPAPDKLIEAYPNFHVGISSPAYEIDALRTDDTTIVVVGPDGERWYGGTGFDGLRGSSGAMIDAWYPVSVSPDGEVLAVENRGGSDVSIYSGHDGSVIIDLDTEITAPDVVNGIISGQDRAYNLLVYVPDPSGGE